MYMQYLLCALREVWSLLWEIPVPDFALDGVRLQRRTLTFYLAAVFPLFGVMVWLGLVILGAVAGILPGRIAAGMLFGVLAVFFLEILGGGTGLSSSSSFMEKLLGGEGLSRSIFTTESDIRVTRSPVGLMSMFFLLFLRGGSLGMLYAYHCTAWFGVVFVLSYALQAQLAFLPSLSSGEKIVDPGPFGSRILWIVAGVAALIFGCCSWWAVLVALAVAAAAAWGLHVFFRRTGGVTGVVIGSAGYVFETLLLLLGAGMLLR
ncbi:MAG: hypothetical protein PHQ27_03815 [Victivallales bacterium]|nr:hypothetical protein [Victivallales bacterium]